MIMTGNLSLRASTPSLLVKIIATVDCSIYTQFLSSTKSLSEQHKYSIGYMYSTV